ncbi:MAG: glycosyltransferase family 4 protein [Patescibacteria group bacterium]
MAKAQAKKILLLTGIFYPDVFGGSGKLVYYHAKELVRQGFAVTVLTRKYKEEFPSHENLEGIEIYRYESKLNKIWGKSLTDIFVLPKIIKKFCQNTNFDLAMFYDEFQVNAFVKAKVNLPAIYVFLASYAQELALEGLERKTGIKFIDGLIKNIWVKILNKIEINNLKIANKIVVLSEFSKKIILEILPQIDKQKIKIIPGGVDLGLFTAPKDKNFLKTELNLPLNKLVILTVRRLVGRTGVDNLIAAVSQLKKVYPDFVLLIIGSGFLAAKLKTMVAELNLQANVKFLGFIKENDLVKYYQAADLFVLPTLAYEGFGLATLEALACGTPVLGTPVGATPEILSKINKSYILAGNEPEAIFQGINNFIKQKDKPENYNLSQQLRQFVIKNYSWTKSGQSLKEEIATLLGLTF